MDPQWNMFQPSSIPDKVVMDYNRIVSQNHSNYSSATNSVNYPSANNSLNYSATNSANYSPATNSSNYSPATNSSNYSSATNSSNYSSAANSSNYSSATNSSNYSSAPNSTNYTSASNSMGYGSYSDYSSNQFPNMTKQSPKYNSMGPPDYSNYLPAPSQGQQNNMNFMQEPSCHIQPSNYYSSGNRSSSQYSPPPPDFKIGTFTLDSTMVNNSVNSSSQSNSYDQLNGSNNQSMRETGIIEKLLQTYGFIQCCERQARLFFHFSQFDGNTEHLRIGDPVEFEVTFDKRTGKPIASSVTKISPEVVLSEERVIGSVTTELRNESCGEHQGRITYENRGECFFLPYGKDDVEGYVTLKPIDKVSFQIATNQRTGNLGACHIRLENPAKPVKYQGVVSAIKESYGFIERADVVDEIFFHFSEAKCIPDGLKLGDDVEFLIQTHNGKEVATSMVKLSAGTVVFEDVDNEEMKGQVLKPVEKMLKQNQKEPLNGRIRYRGKDRSEVEVKFGERDQRGDFTLKHGDWVKFNIATDRRDHLQKATSISLLDESFYVSGEKREQGVICILKEDFGFIKCADRDCRMHFSYDELLDPQIQLSVGDEVQFTVVSDQTGQSANRQSAIRIRKLQPGTVKFEVLIQEEMEGEVMIEPKQMSKSPTNVGQSEENIQPGIITYTIDNLKQNVNYYPKGHDRGPQVGDRVIFNMYLIKRTKERIATDIKIVSPLITTITPNPSGSVRQSMVGSGRTFDRGSINTSTIQTMVAANGPIKMDSHITPANTLHRDSSYTEKPILSAVSEKKPDIAASSDRPQVYATAELGNKYCRSFSTNDNRNFTTSDSQAFSLKDLKDNAEVNNRNFTTGNVPSFLRNTEQNMVSQDHASRTATNDNRNCVSIDNANVVGNKSGRSISVDNERIFPANDSNCSSTPDNERSDGKDSSPVESRDGKLFEDVAKIEQNGVSAFGPPLQAPLQRGFVAALKDTFGFVETLHHDKEIFFHYSNVDGDSANFELGREVEYTISARTGPGGKLSAEQVRLLPVGSIPSAKILGEVFEGTVLRPMRAANPDQQDYCGLLCVGKKDEKPIRRHQFGITGLANKKELLQPNDQVTFQLDEDGWAVNICAIRKKLIAVVEAVKGQYGFLNYENEEGKKLFFHQTEVKDGIVLSPGDEIEFVIITNQKTGKSSACNITRLAASANSGPSQRPDRLVSKLKGLALDSSKPRLQIIRQPKGPDGTKGFKLERKLSVSG